MSAEFIKKTAYGIGLTLLGMVAEKIFEFTSLGISALNVFATFCIFFFLVSVVANFWPANKDRELRTHLGLIEHCWLLVHNSTEKDFLVSREIYLQLTKLQITVFPIAGLLTLPLIVPLDPADSETEKKISENIETARELRKRWLNALERLYRQAIDK